jgi:two-component system chemotaxis response regulator CheY
VKILVADDSADMRQTVVRSLRRAGYGHCQIVEAVDGRDALTKVYEQDPDLVLSDWNMPQMTGIALLSTLRSAGDQRPFGFVTARGSGPMRDVAVRAGALFLIAMPVTTAVLRAALEPVLG